jgi:RNA polymerase sigma-70 factor (ECF subfamily)
MRAALPQSNSDETKQLLCLANDGDQQAWEDLLQRYRRRLETMLMLRLDPRLRGRLDVADVLQEVYLEAFQHLSEYLRRPDLPFYLWLRGIAGNKLTSLYRHHLGVQAREVGREISLFQGPAPPTSSFGQTPGLIGREPPPSEEARKAEECYWLQQALNRMDPVDREVLALRHFEELTNGEAAQVLGLSESATSKRYVRGLGKLKEILVELPGGREMWS